MMLSNPGVSVQQYNERLDKWEEHLHFPPSNKLVVKRFLFITWAKEQPDLSYVDPLTVKRAAEYAFDLYHKAYSKTKIVTARKDQYNSTIYTTVWVDGKWID